MFQCSHNYIKLFVVSGEFPFGLIYLLTKKGYGPFLLGQNSPDSNPRGIIFHLKYLGEARESKNKSTCEFMLDLLEGRMCLVVPLKGLGFEYFGHRCHD